MEAAQMMCTTSLLTPSPSPGETYRSMHACAVLSGDTKSSDTNSGEEEMVGPSRESPLAPVICSTKDFPQEQ